jgi:acetyl esterase/lipase
MESSLFKERKSLSMKKTFFILALTFAANIANAQVVPTYQDVSYVNDTLTSHKLDIYIPSSATSPSPCVVRIHGGGWKGGAKGNALNWCDSLYYNGYVVVDINYRLSGKAIFPAQIYDCKAAIRFLKANASLYYIDTCKIGVIGESAGGHLSALLGTSGGVSALEDFSLGNANVTSRVHAAVDLYGPTNFFIMDANVPDTPPDSCVTFLVHNVPTSPESQLLGCDISLSSCSTAVLSADPITYITPDDPPFLIRHGGFDCSVAPYSSQLLHDALVLNGVSADLLIVPGAGHGGPFGNSSYASQYRQFFDSTLKYVNPCSLTTGINKIDVVMNRNSAPFLTSSSFGARTVLSFHLQGPETVSLRITDVSGKVVATLIPGTFLGAGSHRYEWNASHLSRGLFFGWLKTGNGVSTVKIVK